VTIARDKRRDNRRFAWKAAVSEGAPAPMDAPAPPCEHVFALTSKGSIVGQLQRALAKGDVLAVRSLAGEMPSVPLPLAAEITILLLEREPESYAPAARRLLTRLAEEGRMPLRQLADVAALLAELEADPAPRNAGKQLISLAS
jgi:hypothetical protein